MGIFGERSGNSKISIKSLFLVKNEIIKEKTRKYEKTRELSSYVRI